MTGRKRRIDQADERRDGEAGDGLVRVEGAEHLDGAGVEADLLLRLAQRRGERRRVARILLAAGKGDLARVVLQERRAPGQDQPQAAAALDERHQHRGGAQPRRRVGSRVGVEVEVGGAAGGRAERVADLRRVEPVAVHRGYMPRGADRRKAAGLIRGNRPKSAASLLALLPAKPRPKAVQP